MKHKFLKSFALIALMMCSMGAWAIDWSTISWVQDSNDKFKVAANDNDNLPGVGSLQKPGWAAESGIYLTFPAADITCSHACAVDGAGICLYISQFYNIETEVTVNYAGGSKTFTVYYADGIDFSAPAPIASEYCNYSGPQTTQDGKACAITWITNNAGDVVISLSDGPAGGYTGVSFRGDCFEGDFDLFKVISAANGIENASVYFTRERSAAENYYILRKNATALPDGKIIIKTNATLAWTSNENASRYQNAGRIFSYTYGTTCPSLEAPTNVAVAADGTITFDAVDGAEKYVAHVFNGVKEVYSAETANGEVINYLVYEATTLTVKLEAISGGLHSDLSDPANWDAAASQLPSSIWCETLGVIAVEHETCHPAFTINTLDNGNVTIVINATEGTPEGAKFRGANGMNGTFTLNGSADDFTTCFNKALSVDKTTITLSLKGTAPTLGSIIDYTGQIEAASSLHGNDWSTYDILGYVYGTKCPDVEVTGVALDKTVAELPLYHALTLNATISPYNATNQELVWTSSNENIVTVNNGVVHAVTEGSATVTVTSTADPTKSASCVVTVVPATEKTSYGMVSGTANNAWTGTWDGNSNPTYNNFPFAAYYKIDRKLDNTLSITVIFVSAPAADGKTLLGTPGLVLEIVDYKGGTHFNTLVDNHDGSYTATTTTIFDDEENVRLALRVVYNAGESLTDIHYTVGSENVSTNVSVSSVGYATYYTPDYAYVMPTGLTGYIFNATANNIVSTYSAGSVVPAGEALVLKGEEDTYTLNYTLTATAKNANNALLGTATTTTTTAPDAGDYWFYGLSLNNDGDANSVGFYWREDNGAAFTNGANKAYLALPQSGSPKAAIVFDTNEVTDVENVTIATGIKYDIMGRIIANPVAGQFYIMDGKKYIAK